MAAADPHGRSVAAFVTPLFLFLGILAVVPLVKVENSELPWFRSAPEHWVYPLQIVLCLGVLVYFWRQYTFRPFAGTGLAVILGIGTIAVWIAPAAFAEVWGIGSEGGEEGSSPWRWLGMVPRNEGFDPHVFADSKAAYLTTVGMRFVRMAIVVPLVEEIFWRGFLMRWLVDTDRPFWKTPFGTYSPVAVGGTTLLFILAHQPSDYLGALVFGLAMAWLAIRTKSLWACVLMHAVANFVLGIYVLLTQQWGFW